MRWTPSPMRSGAPAALGLTPRESEVMAWVVRGESNPQIAKRLSIAPGTVKKHLEHVYAKLGVKTRTEAAVRVAPYFGFSFSD
jgi:DNA-binding CsgD family transcriptional regulator